MPHYSLNSALEEASPAACKVVYAAGVRFVVCIEKANGQWVIAHANDQEQAGNIARAWVNDMGARGASLRRLFDHGVAPKPFASVYAQPQWEE